MDCILSISIISLHKKLSSAWENVSQPTNWFEAIEAHANPYVPYVPYVPHIHLNKFITHLKSKYHKNKLITKKKEITSALAPVRNRFFPSSFLPSFLSIYLPIAITTIYEQRMTNPPPRSLFVLFCFILPFFLFLLLISESSEVLALVLSY